MAKVLDIDDKGRVRGIVSACECHNWAVDARVDGAAAAEAWVKRALSDPTSHHPQCSRGSTVTTPAIRGNALEDFGKAVLPLVDVLNGVVQFVNRNAALVGAGYLLYKLAGPAATYAATRAGTAHGNRRRKRRRNA